MIVLLFAWEPAHIHAVEETLEENITVCRTREEALAALPEADIVLTLGGAPLLDEALLSAAVKLKLVLSLSAGIERLPLAALHARDIAVCNTKGVHAATIAEFVLGGMLSLSHHFPLFMHNQTRAFWQNIFVGEDLEGKTLLVVGAGHIGSEIARKAKAFDMTVLGTRRHPEPAPYFDEMLDAGALHRALPRADFVVVAVPLTNETCALMGAEEFALMKTTAVFVNISRGSTVDEEALLVALREKRLAGAVLDVFRTEPLPADSPFWSLENVLVTPHSSGLSNNSTRKTINLLCENIARFRAGRPLINQIIKGEKY